MSPRLTPEERRAALSYRRAEAGRKGGKIGGKASGAVKRRGDSAHYAALARKRRK